MEFTLFTFAVALALLLGMLALLEMGRRFGLRQRPQPEDGVPAGLGAVEAAVFGLLGLLIAFTFGGAATRFDSRRELAIDEAILIGTAWQRVDLLPVAAQPPLRDLFRSYLDSRIQTYRSLPDFAAALGELTRSRKLQDEIWTQAVRACHEADSQPVTLLLLPALNQMIDVSTKRILTTRIHPPLAVFVMLGALALLGALLVGHSMSASGAWSWIHVIGFVAAVSMTVYVTIDMEYPRLGLIRINAIDEVLVDLQKSMQ